MDDENTQPQGAVEPASTGYAHSCCSEIGMTMEPTKVEQLPDGTWRASAEIGTIFGADVQGEVSGTGATKDEALAALQKERHDLHESLWA